MRRKTIRKEVRISVQDPWFWYQQFRVAHISNRFIVVQSCECTDSRNWLGLAVAKRIAEAMGGNCQ